MKLKKIVRDFGSTLAAENEHRITRDGYWKVATSWRTFPNLNNFFPCPLFALHKMLNSTRNLEGEKLHNYMSKKKI